MKKYIPAIRKNRYCFILAPILMILEAAGEFILPYLNANIIDKGAATGDIAYIVQNGLLMAATAIFMLVCGVGGAYFAIKGASLLAADVRGNTFQKIQKLSFAEIDGFSTGSLITRITNDITQIQNFTQSLLRGCCRSPVMLIGALCMSFVLNPGLAAVICTVMVLLVLLIYLLIRTASPRYTVMQEKLDGLNNRINETIINERVIKSFVREEYEKERFLPINEVLMEKSVRALKIMILMQPVSTLAINVTTLAVVWIAGRQIMVGDMTVGALTAFITYLTQILTALNFLANIFLQGTRAAASNRRISEVLNARISVSDESAREKEKKVTMGSVTFEHVSFAYDAAREDMVLKDINLQFLPGQFISIVGSTGSGKSTLISLIPRLYDALSGTVRVDGTDVRDYSLRSLRDGIAVVLQKNMLFSGTIEENLRWGNEQASREELEKACRIAHAEEFINSFPEKYETHLEQGGQNLSGGQRQRLCIARALVKQPKILILDDSTSAVDMATDAGIRRALREELGDITKIIIAQRISSVMDADQIVVMNDGRVEDMGTHRELMARCRTYQEIYYSQKEKEEDAQ